MYTVWNKEGETVSADNLTISMENMLEPLKAKLSEIKMSLEGLKIEDLFMETNCILDKVKI